MYFFRLPKKLITVDEQAWNSVMTQLQRINDIVDGSDEEEWETIDEKIRQLYQNPIFNNYLIPDQTKKTDQEKLAFIDGYLRRKEKERQDKKKQDADRERKKMTKEQKERAEKNREKKNASPLTGYSSAPLTQDEYNILTNATDALPPLQKRQNTFATTPPTPPYHLTDVDEDDETF